MKRILPILAITLSLLVPSTVMAQGSASFSWSQNSLSIPANSEASVTLSLNTAGTKTSGADVMLSYDPTKVEVVNVAFSNPNLYALNFNKTSVQTSVINLTSTYTDVSGNYSGSASYATITFKGLALGTTTLNWDCQAGETKDSNILQQGTGTDILNCGSLSPLSITVTQASSTSSDTTATTTTTNDAVGSSTTSCSALQTAPTGLSAKAQSSSAILLTWTKESNANNYTLKYGTSPNSYQYGAANIGNSGSFLVSALRPNTTYYFAIAGVNSCSTSAFITTSGKTGTSGTAAVAVAPNTPSFTTLVAQVNQTQPEPVATPAPVRDERLPNAGTPTLEKENFLSTKPAQAETSADAPLVSPAAIAAGVAVVILAIGGGAFFALRKPAASAVVTTVTESPMMPKLEEVKDSKPTPIPPLGG